MLTAAEADLLVRQHLANTPRARHSRLVGYVMRQLAADFSADADLWETVGLCHDLDFFETRNDPTQHGLLTARWLGDRIPQEARRAIEAHDHRTGVAATTLLADMLKLADVMVVIDAALGRRALAELESGEPLARLRTALSERPYLCAMLEQYSEKHGVALVRIAAIASGMPGQLH
jgi:predicted hydrolase (HD superfamily)